MHTQHKYIKYDVADIASNEKLLAWANMSAV